MGHENGGALNFDERAGHTDRSPYAPALPALEEVAAPEPAPEAPKRGRRRRGSAPNNNYLVQLTRLQGRVEAALVMLRRQASKLPAADAEWLTAGIECLEGKGS
jgi:hypothetical protein